jgi:hypothetical protein
MNRNIHYNMASNERIVFEIDLRDNNSAKTLGQLKTELKDLKTSLDGVQVGSKNFQELQSKIVGVNSELKGVNQSFKALDAKAAAPVANTMAAIRQSVIDLKKELSNTELGTKEFDILQAKLQEANGKFRDFREDIKGWKPDEVFKGVSSLAAAITGSFAVATGVMQAFGVESKAVADAEKSAQAAIAVALGASTIAREADSASKLIAFGQSKLLTASLYLEKTATEGGTVARYAAIQAQKVLNALMNASSTGIFLTAITLITGAFLIFSRNSDKAAESQEAFNKKLEDSKRVIEAYTAAFEAADKARQNEFERSQALAKAQGATDKQLAEARIRKLEADKSANEQQQKDIIKEFGERVEIEKKGYQTIAGLQEDINNNTKTTADSEKKLKDLREENKNIVNAIKISTADIAKFEKDQEKKQNEKNEKLEKEAKERDDKAFKDKQAAEKLADEIADTYVEANKLRLETEKQQEKDARATILQTKLEAAQNEEKINGESVESLHEITEAKIAILQNEQLDQTENLEENSKLRYAIEKKYTQQIIDLKKEENEQKKKLTLVQTQDTFSQFANLAKSLSQLAKKNSEEQRELTLFGIALDTAAGIAGAIAIASKSSATVYDYISAIAAGIGAVLAGISQAKAAMPSSDAAYAEGGVHYVSDGKGAIVRGPGTSTSDSINAHLSNNEAVINANSTRMFLPLLSYLNRLGGGRDFAGGMSYATGYIPNNNSNGVSSIFSPQLDKIQYLLEANLERTPVVQSYVVENEMTTAQFEKQQRVRRARRE